MLELNFFGYTTEDTRVMKSSILRDYSLCAWLSFARPLAGEQQKAQFCMSMMKYVQLIL